LLLNRYKTTPIHLHSCLIDDSVFINKDGLAAGLAVQEFYDEFLEAVFLPLSLKDSLKHPNTALLRPRSVI
jgi:hypothetical protein